MEDGTGSPPEIPNFQDLVGDYLGVSGGREYLVQVPGASQALLDDEAVAQVLNYVIDRFANDSRPEKFVRYTQAEVRRLRHNGPTDVYAERERLQQAIAKRR